MWHAQRVILVAAVIAAVGYAWVRGAFVSLGAASETASVGNAAGTQVATFALGCFWSAESAFEGLPGVVAVTAGYTGGWHARPTYEQVSAGATGHAEAVEVQFDPSRMSYAALLDRFWHSVDPFTAHRQFCDLGDQYRPAIFVHDERQRAAADDSRARWERHFGRHLKVSIEAAGPFFHAEAYHQDYAARHPVQYRLYRWSCGRDRRLAQIWQAPHLAD